MQFLLEDTFEGSFFQIPMIQGIYFKNSSIPGKGTTKICSIELSLKQLTSQTYSLTVQKLALIPHCVLESVSVGYLLLRNDSQLFINQETLE